MDRIWIAICLTTLLLVGQAIAADRGHKAKTARKKAGVLEHNASAMGNKVLPPPSVIITKPEAQAVDPAGEGALDDAITCLARTIYWEAKSEGPAGMEAVANVVMNRLGHKSFPNTICGIVRQGSEKGACQFGWWCDGRSDDAEEGKSYAIAKEIARKALNMQLMDQTDGALYFNQKKAISRWSGEYGTTVEIGEHVFYKAYKSTAN
jgi:spore germination cell wall hydrolase CwlJ-like protein